MSGHPENRIRGGRSEPGKADGRLPPQTGIAAMVELADEGNSRPAQAGGGGPGEEQRQGHGRLHNELLGQTR